MTERKFSKMLRKLVVGPYQSNCYILGDKPTREGVVIDPGDDVSRIVKEISGLNLTIKNILITHGHIDHIGGAAELRRITGAGVWIHPLDEPGLGFAADGPLTDGRSLSVGSFRLKAIHTPGHSPGGVCLYVPGVVFTGDTLFAGSVGRTDFPGGSHRQLIQGVVQKIFPLGADTRVYPGHGPRTTVGRERAHNPFFRLQQPK
jgi:glyoxylase-like metal-dependent hydrolase (beta-lactamase superfamily II)